MNGFDNGDGYGDGRNGNGGGDGYGDGFNGGVWE